MERRDTTTARRLCQAVKLVRFLRVPTLRQVAQRAGVSVATASRVLNGLDSVKPETRERVQVAMRDLMYVPPRHAGLSGAIGLLVPELANPIFPALAQAMETRAKSFGFASILCNTAGSPATEASYVQMLLERQVDGMIFISSEVADLEGDHRHYGRLRELGAKLVFVNGAPALDAPVVGVDERAAGVLATRHLIELGHTRIGFVAGPGHFLPTQEKARGRLDALRRAQLEPQHELVVYEEFGFDGGGRALERLLKQRPAPTAVICSSDVMAIGALKAARASGLRVPGDMSIVGFDGIEAANWTEPPLTTVEQPIPEIAEAALEALWARLEEPERHVPNILFRPQLRRGATTAAPA
jgi:DNA-binding LacI/PurR family transcriptional regulator